MDDKAMSGNTNIARQSAGSQALVPRAYISYYTS